MMQCITLTDPKEVFRHRIRYERGIVLHRVCLWEVPLQKDLQLMQSAGSGHSWSNESRTQAVSDISRMLKIMAKQLNVPVICLSQLSRANESRTDKRPMLSDLRESGAIEQDADVVIGLYRDGYYNRECENPNLAEAIVLKNRKGQTGTVNLTWVPEYTSFYSVEKYRDNEA